MITFGTQKDARSGKQGFYLGIPEPEYNALPGVRRTEIRWLSDSPALCAHNRKVPFEKSYLLIGAATHCAVFEPLEFPKRYHIGPPVDMKRLSVHKTEAGKKAYEAWELKNPGVLTKDQWADLKAKVAPKELLRGEEAAVCAQLAKVIQKHPRAWEICCDPDAEAWNEVTVLWTDPRTGIKCKCRVDRLFVAESGALVALDLKTIVQATTGRIKQAWNRGLLHLQAAFYGLGVTVASGGLPCDFILLWVGKEAPHLVRMSRLKATRRAICETEVLRLLSIYDVCEREDRWEDRSHEIDELDVPHYLLDDAFVEEDADDETDETEEEESPF